jgi:cytochrome c oxidase assembly protein subunit 15
MSPIPTARHRFAVVLALSTLALVFVGGLVTSTGSGLSVPDWPLSYGMVMPPMVGGVFYEHGHRMVAATVGFLTLLLAIWTQAREPRRGVRRLAWTALALVIAQGTLGGLTVLFLLPTPVSVAHACLAQCFFCVTIALAYATSTEWARADRVPDRAGMRVAAAAATAVVFVQLVLGATMRHRGAGLAIPDFPLAFGRLFPPFDDPSVALHFAHRVGALAVLAAVLVLAARAQRSGVARLARLARFAGLLVLVQIALGSAAVLTGRSVLPTTAHVAVGAAVLGTCWLTTLRVWRLVTPLDKSAARSWSPEPLASASHWAGP